MALVVAGALTISMASVAFAAPESDQAHTITITNTDQNVSHTYTAYQIFSGNLDAKELTLSDIDWGSGVDGEKLLTALQNSTDANLKATTTNVTAGTGTDAGKYFDALGKEININDNLFKNCSSATDVAKVLATFQSTGQKYDENGKATLDDGTKDSAGAIDAVATIIGDTTPTVLKGDGTSFTEDNKSYAASVTGDGYYFIKDGTTNLNNTTTGKSDTKSKYLLSVIKDTTIVAKDTGLNPDKEIVTDTTANTTAKADTAAIGDTVTFQVKINVPNTKKYENHFVFNMFDQLPVGLTFTGVSSIKVVDTDDATKTLATLAEGTNYTVTAKTGTETSYSAYEVPTDPVAAAGGQAIKVVFNNFKTYAEADYDSETDGTQDLIGDTIIITYTAVLNDDAEYEADKNENTVTFKYSTDPNHDYTGDEPGPDDDNVIGTTPESKTRTYTTSLKIKKVDENGDELAGATFELKGSALNRTVLTGTRFEASDYEVKGDEEIEQASGANVKYWLLKDGTYTATDPLTVQNKTQYATPTSTTFVKVKYTFDEVAAKDTDLKVVTDDDGIAEFVGLNEGTDYTLEEIAAPDGYNKIDGIAKITISWVDPEGDKPSEMSAEDWAKAQAQGGYLLTESNNSKDYQFGIAWNSTDKQFEVEIKNMSGAVLPSTGGMGTTVLYVVGAIIIIGAGVLLVTRRKMAASK